MTKFQHTATALAGAILISTAFVTAAVGPAAAVERQGTDHASVEAPVSVQANA